jgi:hypothetical protein
MTCSVSRRNSSATSAGSPLACARSSFSHCNAIHERSAFEAGAAYQSLHRAQRDADDVV